MEHSDIVLLHKAQELYEACPTPKPAWSTLGPNTQGVWLGYVKQGLTPSNYHNKNKHTLE